VGTNNRPSGGRLRRLLLALIALGFVVTGTLPTPFAAGDRAVAQVVCEDGSAPDEKGECPKPEPECPRGEVWDPDREECVTPECAKDEVFDEEKGCVKPGCTPPEEPVGPGGRCQVPFVCWNGEHVATEDQCDPPPQGDCPPDAQICGQIRSCPIDSPLGGGASCETPAPTTTTAPPVPPSPSPVGDRGTFGRPAEVEGSGDERPAPVPAPAPAPAPAPLPDLARTGPEESLAAIGAGMLAIGLALVRIGRPSRGSAKHRPTLRQAGAAAAAVLVGLVVSAAPALAEAPADPGSARDTAPGQVKRHPGTEECPEGQVPTGDGGCTLPTCPDGSEVPESGECPASCPEGSEICGTRSCPVDSPLPPGALCEDGSTAAPSVRDTPDSEASRGPTSANAAEGGGGAVVGAAVSASVFGRPAEVLGVQVTREAVPPMTALPAVAATGAETVVLALVGGALVVIGALLLRASHVPQASHLPAVSALLARKVTEGVTTA